MTEASSSEIRAAIDVYSGTYHRLISYAKFVALTVDLLLCQLSALSLKSGYEEWRCKSRYYVTPSCACAVRRGGAGNLQTSLLLHSEFEIRPGGYAYGLRWRRTGGRTQRIGESESDVNF